MSKQGGFSFAMNKKKTPFQRHKEAEQERKRRAEEEAAKVYEEFVDSFQAEDKSGPKEFVHGGTIGTGHGEKKSGFSDGPPGGGGSSSKKSSKYVPFMPPGMAAAVSGSKPKEAQESVFSLPSGSTSSTSKAAAGGSSKPRAIDMVLENLKREQEQREERSRLRKEGKQTSGFDLPPDDLSMAFGMGPGQPGSFDDGDPGSTNLYVGNLAPDVDEEVLKREFGRFGPIGSVKVMWPRTDEERRRNRNCGFVAFMERSDAAAAKNELNGIQLHGQELRLGWGKSVPLPSAPTYVQGVSEEAKSEVAAQVALPFVPWNPAAPVDVKAGGALGEDHGGVGPDLVVEAPKDARLRFTIDTVACYVLRDGCSFEQALMEREAGNAEYGFLFRLDSQEHAYYRWRLYSLASGDTLRSWRVEPFVMVAPGPRWVPPPMTGQDGSHQTQAQRRAGRGAPRAHEDDGGGGGGGGGGRDPQVPLSDIERDKLEDLLRGLTVARTDIRDAMVFALDHAESAGEVVEVMSESLCLPETPLPTKVARLFLVSDVLHNSSSSAVRGASRYRSRLEEALPAVFESLQETYRSLGSRMQQEGLRRHVLRVLRVWRERFIFSDDFLNGLQATFLRAGAAEFRENEELALELAELTEEQLTSRAKRNGVSREGGRESIISRLLHLDYYLHGERQPDIPPAAAAKAAAEKQQQQQASRLAKLAAASNGGGFRPVTVHAEHKVGNWDGADAEDGASTPPGGARVRESTPDIDTGAGARRLGKLVGAAVAEQPTLPMSKWVTATVEEAAAGEAARRAAGSTAAAGSDSDEDDMFSGAADAAAAALTAGTSGRGVGARGGGAGSALLRRPTASSQQGSAGAAAGSRLDAAGEEERRKRLREVEVAVMQYREELEEQQQEAAAAGHKGAGMTQQELDERVAAHRARLVEKAESSGRRSGGAGGQGSARDKSSGKHEARESSKDRDNGGGRRSKRSRSRSPPALQRHKSSSSKDKVRDKDKDKDKSKDKVRGGSSRHSSRENKSSRHRSRSRSKSRGKSRSRSRDRSHKRRRS